MIRLMNSAMMPDDGIYINRRISQREFVEKVKSAANHSQLRSYIGYKQTAEFIEKITGVKIEVSRDETKILDSDILLICKLKYRATPASKGQPVNEDDFEFFECRYLPRIYT